MSDLPDDPDRLTEEQAREAKPGPATDHLIDQIIGPVTDPGGFWTTDAEDARRAREWLRKQTSYEVVVAGEYAAFYRNTDYPEPLVYGPTEELATARLVLVAHTRGLLEGTGE